MFDSPVTFDFDVNVDVVLEGTEPPRLHTLSNSTFGGSMIIPERAPPSSFHGTQSYAEWLLSVTLLEVTAGTF